MACIDLMEPMAYLRDQLGDLRSGFSERVPQPRFRYEANRQLQALDPRQVRLRSVLLHIAVPLEGEEALYRRCC